MTWRERLEALIAEQQTTRYVDLVRREFNVEFVDHVRPEHHEFFVGRCRALLEEEHE